MARQGQLFQYQPLAEPVFSAPRALSWGPKYPDAVLRQQLHPALLSGFVFVSEPSPLLAWRAQYPDAVRRSPWPHERSYRPMAAMEEVDVPASLFPSYIIQARPRPAGQQQYLGWGVFTPAPSLPFWTPIYPDQLTPPRLRPQDWTMASPSIATYNVPSLAWDPAYDDFARQNRLHPAVPGYTVYIPGLANFEVPPLAWGAIYPDRAPGASPLPRGAYQSLATTPAQAAYAVPSLAWDAVYPAFPGRQRPAPTRTGLAAWTEGLTPELAWSGTYPDILWRAGARQPGWQTLVQYDFVVVDTTPALAWLGRFPDFAPGARSAAGAPYLSWGIFTPVPSLPFWTPMYPDALVQPRLRQQEWTALVAALANYDIPLLGWAGTAPDALRARRVLTPQEWAALTPMDMVFPAPLLAWLAAYPDFARAVARATSTVFGWTEGLTPLLSWLPGYPDRINIRPPVHNITQSTYTVGQAHYAIPPVAWAPLFPDFPGRSPLTLRVELRPALSTFFRDSNVFTISGKTRDSVGAILGVCRVKLFRTSDNAFIASTVSAADGAFAFTVTDNTTGYFMVSWKDNVPQIAGTSRDDILGA